MNFDVDSHFTPPSIYENPPSNLTDVPKIFYQDGRPRLRAANGEVLGFSRFNFDLQARINAMKEGGFDKQLIGNPLQPLARDWVSKETEIYLVGAWNDAVSKIIAEHDCFVGSAQISHKDPDAAIAEADRAIKDLGFSAISIEGVWSGRNIESPEWLPFFAAVEKLNVPLLCHSNSIASYNSISRNVPASEQMKNFYLIIGALIEFPILYMIAMSGLIFSGILDRHPSLKVAWLESDVGWVPGFMNLIDGAYDTAMVHAHGATDKRVFGAGYEVPDAIKIRKRPSKYFLDHFYFSINFGTDLELKKMLPYIIREVGFGKQIMIESDFDHEEGSLDIVRKIRNLEELNDESKERICGRNACELLNVKWAPSAYESIF